MTPREQEIIRLALLFMMSNLDDINEAFESEDGDGLNVNGLPMALPTEEEISNCLKLC